ncbi:MAG: glycosyltransferase family 2 protein [Bacteroidales bacterium]|jgi:cellulose synthase/poly-beta-1,6-N-acetylglucosamine synthase-like glycosyltransferase|nr:glycosyltransferase family 2 protein [Bacteroidales bacterium]
MEIKILFWALLFIVFYTYLGYGILLYLIVKMKEGTKKLSNSRMDKEPPHITLLVAAYNEEDVAQEKIENSLALDYPKEKLHLMWVTDGSTDNTNAIIERYPSIELLHQERREGKSAAVNRAIPYIKTPIVVFSDANAMLNREAINEIVNAFRDPIVGCVAGEKKVLYKERDSASSSGEGIYWKYESFLKELDSRLYSAVGAAGELYAIRTELYNNVEKSVLLDDFILSMRIAMRGYKIKYCKNAYATEYGAMDMKEEAKRKVRISAGGIQSVIMLRALLNIFKYRLLSFQYISHRVLRWTITPVALFLLLPLNIAIVFLTESPLYLFMLIIHLLFYFISITGYFLAEKNIKVKLFFIPYYFMFMNYSVIRGVGYLYKKRGSGVWEKSKRAKIAK